MPKIIQKEIISERLHKLREKMKPENIDMVILSNTDYHNSEYSSEYFKDREYFSGFTGSAGTLLVTKDSAYLFTDGRYFVQAELQLKNGEVKLMKSGTKDVPTISEFVSQCASAADHIYRVAFDGRTVSASFGERLSKIKNVEIEDTFYAGDYIWQSREDQGFNEIYPLDVKYTGEDTESKLNRIRKAMADKGTGIHIVTSLDDIAWILNCRGKDIVYTPLFFSYLIITDKKCTAYVNMASITDEAKISLSGTVEFKEYGSFYNEIKTEISSNDTVLVDKNKINYSILKILSDSGCNIIYKMNPSTEFKAIKNDTEIENLKKIHIEDGVCVAKLMFYIKRSAKKNETVTELDAVHYIDKLRSEISDYVELSFPTISAAGANAAQMHYAANEENQSTLNKGEMLLVDSGGHYLRGTTDITRTFAYGECDEEMKQHFTLVLKGMLALSDAVFLKGCSGYSLDILARAPMWKEGLDYRCGTGHGVGYMTNVHEGPNAFSWRYIPNVSEYTEILPGMVTTDEPGVYLDGEYGIRIENELLCVNRESNEYGDFLEFETLTHAPIDVDLIDTEILTDREKELINNYHNDVFRELAPYMDGDDLNMLKKYTKTIV